MPTPKTENLYFTSINKTVDNYGALLGTVQKRSLKLPDDDLDSGKATAAGEYILADDTYAKLLSQIADKKFDATTPALQAEHSRFLLRSGSAYRDEEGPGQVAEGADQPRRAEGAHAEPSSAAAPQAQPQRRLRRAGASGKSSAKIREECSLCRMPENALGLACCSRRPTGSSGATKRPLSSAPTAPASPR